MAYSNQNKELHLPLTSIPYLPKISSNWHTLFCFYVQFHHEDLLAVSVIQSLIHSLAKPV